MDTSLQDQFKAGFIAVSGRPNVGKSTLINALLNQKVAAVTPRPQTTRRQQLGILTLDHAQLVFVDTPGIHQSRNKLGELMNEEAGAALEEGDVILAVVDVSQKPKEEDRLLAQVIQKTRSTLPLILALNKIDLLDDQLSAERKLEYQSLFTVSTLVAISAKKGVGINILLDLLIENLPDHPPFFPLDQVTDFYEREIAGDLIREAALLNLRDEVPHGIAIRMDEFKERGDKGAYISATIFLERDSQKSIVIGRNGQMIKRIGTHARREIEAMSGRKVFLELRVKVRKNWRNNDKMLNLFGFKRHKR